MNIETGKDLIENKIEEFYVENGNWTGKVIIENCKFKILAGNKTKNGFHIVNSFCFDENTKLDYKISSIKRTERF